MSEVTVGTGDSSRHLAGIKDDGASDSLATTGRAREVMAFIDGTRECGTISAASAQAFGLLLIYYSCTLSALAG
jgi:hypothetical protein